MSSEAAATATTPPLAGRADETTETAETAAAHVTERLVFSVGGEDRFVYLPLCAVSPTATRVTPWGMALGNGDQT